MNPFENDNEPPATLPVVTNGKQIIVQTEFDQGLKTKIAVLVEELQKTPAITSQEAVVKANETLSKSKKMIDFIDEQRKQMTSVLDQEKKSIMNYQKAIVGELETLTTTINRSIIEFQKEEDRKAKVIAAEIEKKKQAELLKIQAEQARVNKITNLILDFENSVSVASANATIKDIDDKIKKLNSVIIKEEIYMEFFGEAQVMYQRCVTVLANRKTELLELQNLKSKNEDQARQLEEQQKQNAILQAEAVENKKAQAKKEQEEKEQNEIANLQMESELKTAMIEKPSNVMRRWSFDKETVDISLLPLEFHTFDEKKIKEAIKQGAREIPGIVICEELSNVSR